MGEEGIVADHSKGEDRVRRPKEIEAHSKAARLASAVHDALASEQARDKPRPDWTLTRLLDWWMENSVEEHLSQATVYRYAGICRRFIIPSIGSLRLCDVDVTALQTFVDQCMAHEVGNVNVRVMTSVLRRALGCAWAEGAINCNPAGELIRPRVTPRRPSIIMDDDLARFVAACRGEWYGPFFVTAITTGLRKNELRGLRREDLVSIDRVGATPLHILDIRYQIDAWSSEPHWVPLKSDSGVRQVPVPESTYQLLLEHRQQVERQRMRIGTGRWNGYDLLFPSKWGRIASAPLLQEARLRILQRAGLSPMIRLHDLRHSYLVAQVEAGATLEEAAKLLGHADAKTAYRTYYHLTDKTLGDAADRMDRLLGGEPGRS